MLNTTAQPILKPEFDLKQTVGVGKLHGFWRLMTGYRGDYLVSTVSMGIAAIMNTTTFLLLAYFGVKKNLYFLIAGYFIHGLWDFIYSHVGNAELLPPHYDFFCSTYDFIIGFYLLTLKYKK